MKHALARAQREILAHEAAGNLALVFDYDGTLAPIGLDPGKVRMRRTTRRLLADLARLYPVSLLSGREWSDVRAHVPDPAILVVGNHGMQWSAHDGARGAIVGRVRFWEGVLASMLGSTPGISLENKGLSLSVHYRAARNRRAAEAAVARATEALKGARIIGGKTVVNILPAKAADKGDALPRVLSKLRCRRALFLGDDVTDEAVFALKAPHVLTIRVGESRRSQARWYVEDQREVDDLMRLLVDFRSQVATARAMAPRRRVTAR